MKLSSYITAGLLCSMVLGSCKKSEDGPTAPYAKVMVAITNEVDGQPLELGPVKYTNAAGNPYSVDLLKYYISDFILVKADGTERNFRNHDLMDAALPASLGFTLDSVVNGDYTTVKFLIGVDGDHNHTGDQEGDLDPVNGMIWTWNTGYIFFKHEGNYKDGAGAIHPLTFHLGTDKALSYISVPLTKLTVAGKDRKLFLKFNLNKLYAAPGRMDFNTDNNHMSTGTGDASWISAMTASMAGAFQYDKAE